MSLYGVGTITGAKELMGGFAGSMGDIYTIPRAVCSWIYVAAGDAAR
jgi:hypothetical protein